MNGFPLTDAAAVMGRQPVVALCERCGRWIRVGRPYARGSRAGLFVHRGPCLIVAEEEGRYL